MSSFFYVRLQKIIFIPACHRRSIVHFCHQHRMPPWHVMSCQKMYRHSFFRFSQKKHEKMSFFISLYIYIYRELKNDEILRNFDKFLKIIVGHEFFRSWVVTNFLNFKIANALFVFLSLVCTAIMHVLSTHEIS
jgi:hypothetical protein